MYNWYQKNKKISIKSRVGTIRAVNVLKIANIELLTLGPNSRERERRGNEREELI